MTDPQTPGYILLRFLEEPGGHILLDSNLQVVGVGPEYLRLTLNSRDNLLGKSYVNTISEPDPRRHELATDAIRRLSTAALKTKQTQKYGPMRMDIQSPYDSHIEERWWQGAYIPVEVDKKMFLVHRLEDVTTWKVTERKLSAQRRSNYILYGLAVLLLGVTLWVATQNRMLTKSTCRQVQTINTHLLTAVQHQLSLITTPGTALYRFYQRNPGLASQAVVEAQKDLKTFTPKSC